MTLVELFGKYYNGELTNEEEIKRIFKEYLKKKLIFLVQNIPKI